MTLNKIILESLAKNPVGLKEALSEVLAEKIKSALEEKVSELSEISNKLASSYFKKASDELDKDWADARAKRPGLPYRKTKNRIDGVEKAYQKLRTRQLPEDVESLDEISKQTLVNYMDKSKKDTSGLQKKYNSGKITSDEEKRMDRRVSGQITALDKFHGRAKVPASGKDRAYDMAQKALKKE